jgi:hypothetical protein
MKIGYGKIGRSMPLTLDKCGNLGGDVEMVAVVKEMALRHPEHEFWLIGRNSGEDPVAIGLPSNIINPWRTWTKELLLRKRALGLNKANLTVDEHFQVQNVFDDITLPTILSMDQIVLWAGQHGTTNAPIPAVSDANKLTKPHDWCAHYCAFLLRGVNLWRDADPFEREEVWLNADPRNYLKMRDLKWPLRHPVLTQYTFTHNIKHERYNDPSLFEEFSAEHGTVSALPYVLHAEPGDHLPEIRNQLAMVWQSKVHNVYSRLEVNGLRPGTPFGDLIRYNDDWDGRGHFGLFINEARRYVSADTARLNIMRDWVLPLEPTWVHGSWSDESKAVLNMDIRPAPWDQYYPRLHAVRSTFTTPSSGSGWATAKPWEAFAAGTACFFHPGYDTQDNILSDAPLWLRNFLRVNKPHELRERVEQLGRDRDMWLEVVTTQRRHFDEAVRDLDYMRMIEKRIGL